MQVFLSKLSEQHFWKANEECKLVEFFDKKQYRVADGPLTYRQIHILDKDGMLGGASQDAEHKWRKFSFKEIVFLYIVTELKHFGLRNTQLAELYYSFFKDNKKPEKSGSDFADMPLGFVFGCKNVFIFIRTDGDVTFCDSINFPACVSQMDRHPAILINLNEIVMAIQRKFRGKTGLRYTNMLSVFFDTIVGSLQPKEIELLDMIQSGKFETIEILQQDGKVKVIRSKVRKRGNFTPFDLVEVLKAKKYQTVTAHMQDGKVVTYTVEEASK